MKIPAECMSGFTIPAGLRWFHGVFPGQPRTTLAFHHLKTVVQKCVFRSRIAWFDVDTVSKYNIKGKSFIKLRNNNGPKIDPCGTPQFISVAFDKSSVC